MIKFNKTKIISIALIVLFFISISTTVFATIDPNKYNPGPQNQNGTFIDKAEVVLGYIKFFGIIVSVLALAIIGIKYMLSSVEGKAEFKKTMIPYVIGCFMLAGVSLIIQIIQSLATV